MHVHHAAGASAAMVVAAVLTAAAADPPTITTAEAGDHVGKRVRVCGEIVTVGRAFAKREGGKQVFLHFDKEPPNSPFVAVVIGYDLEKYWRLDTAAHRKACVTSYIKRRETMVYAIVDAMTQMTFTDDAPR